MADTESGFSADERAAMKQRAEELRTTKGLKGAAKLAKEFEACVAAIDALEGTDKAVATALHRRDAADSQVVDFLTAADGVSVIDSTDLDFAQTVEAVLRVAAAGGAAPTQENHDGR